MGFFLWISLKKNTDILNLTVAMFRWGGQESKPAAPEGDFKVTIKKAHDSHMLGVVVEEAEDNKFLVKGFRDWGLIAKLNKTHHKETPPEQRLDMRDQDDYDYY